MIVVPKPEECPEDYIRRAGRIAERLGLGVPDEGWIRMVLTKDEPAAAGRSTTTVARDSDGIIRPAAP